MMKWLARALKKLVSYDDPDDEEIEIMREGGKSYEEYHDEHQIMKDDRKWKSRPSFCESPYIWFHEPRHWKLSKSSYLGHSIKFVSWNLTVVRMARSVFSVFTLMLPSDTQKISGNLSQNCDPWNQKLWQFYLPTTQEWYLSIANKPIFASHTLQRYLCHHNET